MIVGVTYFHTTLQYAKQNTLKIEIIYLVDISKSTTLDNRFCASFILGPTFIQIIFSSFTEFDF